MEYAVILIFFMLGVVVGMKIFERMDRKHQKEMQKIDDDFNEWKKQRHKQFIAELDEMDSKSHEYWRDEAMKDFKRKTIDPLTNINNRR